MADLPEVEVYDAGVYQIELTDPVIGGAAGKSNAAAINLSNRTKWLKARVDELSTDSATKVGVQGDIYSHATAGGTADALTLTCTPEITALVDGMELSAKITTTNATTTPTLAVNAIAAKTIVKGAGLALRVSDLPINPTFKYNSTLDKFVLLNPDTGTAGLVALNIQIVTATGTISSSAFGGTLVINSASATTQTLPAASAIPAGKRLEILNIGAGVATIARAGSDTLQVNASTQASIAMGAGDTLTIEGEGATKFYTVGGSAQLGYSATFGNSTTHQKFAGGNILQVGTSYTNASGQIVVTFSTAFVLGLQAALITPIGTYVVGTMIALSTTGFTQQIASSITGAAAGAGVQCNHYSFGR